MRVLWKTSLLLPQGWWWDKFFSTENAYNFQRVFFVESSTRFVKVGSSKAMSFSSNLWKKDSPVLKEMQTNSVQTNSDSFIFFENYIEFVSFFLNQSNRSWRSIQKKKKFDKKKRKKWRKIWSHHFQSREHLYQNSQRGGFE